MTDPLSRAVEEGAKAAAEAAGFNWSACAQSQWRRDMRAGVTAFLKSLEPTPGMKAAIVESCQKMHGTDTEDWKACAWDKLTGFRAMLTALVEEMENLS